MYYVYIIYSYKLQKCYIGYSDDLKRRIREHNSRSCEFTKKGVPWTLVYYSAFIEKEDARSEEKFFKTGQGRQRRKLLLSNFFKNKVERWPRG